MTLTGESVDYARTAFAAPGLAPRMQEVRSPSDPTATPQRFTLQQRHFAVGDQLLVLEKYPVILIHPPKFEFEIEGWDLRLPYGRQGEIGRELLRKVLHLWQKAQQMALSEQEEAVWCSIAQAIDYRRFCLDRAPFRYADGVLESRDKEGCTLIWHDGSRERISQAMGRKLAFLNPGERFQAYAKFGPENCVVDLQNPSPLPPLDGDAEAIWNNWPSNA